MLEEKYELLSEVILNGNARFIPIWENQNFFVKNNDDFNEDDTLNSGEFEA